MLRARDCESPTPRNDDDPQPRRTLIRLIQRSPDAGDGWRAVSAVLWQLVDRFERKELIEAVKNEDGTGVIRLSERGAILADYL